MSAKPVELLIIGAGFSGIGLGMRLLAQGRRDFVILEQAEGVGGTWWVNRYPGCGCDVHSHLYSLSFAPKSDWRHQFAGRKEIQTYLADCVANSGLAAHLHLGTRVEQASWDEGIRRWRIQDGSGHEWQAEILVPAIGGLSRPAWPDIAGLDRFTGRLFHSQQWPDQLELDGQRVAVIGGGASAIQFVPRIQPVVAQLDLYQRTPQWILPKPDRPIARWQQRLFQRIPLTRRLLRLGLYLFMEARLPAFNRYPALTVWHRRQARRFLARQIADPALRSKLSPNYAMGCKRVLMSNDFYPALTRPNLSLISDGIDRIDETGIVGRDGCHRPADIIILATGFQATAPVPAGLISGRQGIDLAEHWQQGPEAYLGSCVHGFPNLFMLLGPNTGLGHNSVLQMLESQIDYLLAALEHRRQAGRPVLEVKASAQRAWSERVQRKLAGSVWNSGGCASWYRHPVSGRNSTLWPDHTWRFRALTRRFDQAVFEPGPAGAGQSR